MTFYRSKIIADRLNSCYTSQSAVQPTAPMSPAGHRGVAMSLNRSLLYRGGEVGHDPNGGMSNNVFARRRTLAYVAGVWARFRHEDDIVFPGDSQFTAEFVANLLNELGCGHVRVEHTIGLIPGGWFVHFEPTSEVTDWLSWRR